MDIVVGVERQAVRQLCVGTLHAGGAPFVSACFARIGDTNNQGGEAGCGVEEVVHFLHVMGLEKHAQEFGGAGIHIVADLIASRGHTVVQFYKEALFVESVDAIDFACIADDGCGECVVGVEDGNQ